jgi:two-component system alkaline phosphatase synthesis response regulator PhoP
MRRVLIIARDSETGAELRKTLSGPGLSCAFTSLNNGVRDAVDATRPDVILLETDDQQPDIPELIRKLKNTEKLPVIALIPGKWLDRIAPDFDVDDFIVAPGDARELIARINRVLRKTVISESSEQIKCNGLTIDLATCEVTVNGALVELTFKEFELLKLMAGNKGRVYTREALLDKIWGYDYYGGDRTVDVHIRRLRSKIEDAGHTYIETVRNIGYRFAKFS